MRSYSVELTNMCMIEDTGRGEVLVLHKTGDWSGIAFPGGHVDPNESFADSVIREVREETGLTIANPIPCGIVHWHNTDDHRKFLVLLYKTAQYSGELLSETEEGRVYWMSKEKMAEADLAPNMSVYLRMFLCDTAHEAYAEWNEKGSSGFQIFSFE